MKASAISRLLFRKGSQLCVSWLLFAGSLIGWPVTALTLFRDEPQGILGLSWLAIILTGYNNLLTIYTNEK